MSMFEIFAREQRELSNSEVARLLSIAESSSSDLLHTLYTLGYLMRTSQSRRYYPTGRLLDTARRISENDPLQLIGREAAQLLAEKTGESAFFGVLDRSAVRVVAAQPGQGPLHYTIEVGARVSLHASALGKSLLGLLPHAEARRHLKDRPLRTVTPKTTTDIDQLLVEIKASRQAGWFETRGEGVEGVTAFAVSEWVGDRPVGLSLAGPAERVERNRQRCLDALREVRVTLFSKPK